MSKVQRKAGRKLVFEALENRAMLAGNVTALVVGGDLVIRGSDEDNAIFIAPGPTDDSVILTPFPGTTINGQEPPNFYTPGPGPCPGSVQTGPYQPRIQLDGITGNWRINLRGGNNTLTTTNDPNLFGCGQISQFQSLVPSSALEQPDTSEPLLRISNNLSIRFGNDGANVVRLHALDVGGNASVRAGDGRLSFELQRGYEGTGNRVAGNLRVQTGDASSRVIMHGLDVGGDVVVNAGEGADTVQISGQVADDVTVRTAGGNDSVGLGLIQVPVLLGAPCIGECPPTPPLVVDATLDVADHVVLDLGQGNDAVQSAVHSRATLIRDVGGDTTIEVLESQIDRLRIQTAGGDDEVTLRSSEIGRFILQTNVGNDRLAIDDTRFVDRAFFDLGGGDDTMFLHRSTLNRGVGRMRGGDDHLNITCMGLNAGSIFDGGDGHDIAGGTSDVGPFVRNFENVAIFDVDENFCNNPLAF